MSQIKHSQAFRLVLMLAVVTLIAGACGGGTKEPKIQKGGTIRVELSEPDSLDPSTADDSEQIAPVRQLYRGLVEYDAKTAKVVPSVAERWEPSAGATVFTFHLRKDCKFTNGDPCDATSFVRGWSRATSKELASPVAYHLGNIKGFADQQAGKTKTLAGVEAVDERTLKVTLDKPDADFVVRTGHPVFSPVPTDAAIAGQKPSWAEFPIGNGPFKMKEAHKHNQNVTMLRNDGFFGAKAFLDEVQFKILADFDTAFTEWQAGNLDWTRIPGGKIKEAKAANPGKFIIRATAGINYLSVNLLKAPTDNINFRKAMSLALDRQAISNAAFAGLQVPATGIIPPALPGYRKPNAQGVGPCDYCRYDVAAAKKALADSGIKLTKPLLLSYNGGAGHEVWMQAVAKQLETNLGIKTTLKAFEPFSNFITFRNGAAAEGLQRNAWGMDFPTPDNFTAPLFDSRSDSIKHGGDNSTHYASPAFDALIDKARSEPDAAKRLKIYQDAEDVLFKDAPTIPMWWRTQFRLAALDKFGGLSMDAFEEATVELGFLKTASTT